MEQTFIKVHVCIRVFHKKLVFDYSKSYESSILDIRDLKIQRVYQCVYTLLDFYLKFDLSVYK